MHKIIGQSGSKQILIRPSFRSVWPCVRTPCRNILVTRGTVFPRSAGCPRPSWRHCPQIASNLFFRRRCFHGPSLVISRARAVWPRIRRRFRTSVSATELREPTNRCNPSEQKRLNASRQQEPKTYNSEELGAGSKGRAFVAAEPVAIFLGCRELVFDGGVQTATRY